MSIWTQIMVAVVILVAIVGATAVTVVSAWKPNDHTQETETWENGVLVRTRRAQATSPVVLWVEMFFAIASAGIIATIIVRS